MHYWISFLIGISLAYSMLIYTVQKKRKTLIFSCRIPSKAEVSKRNSDKYLYKVPCCWWGTMRSQYCPVRKAKCKRKQLTCHKVYLKHNNTIIIIIIIFIIGSCTMYIHGVFCTLVMLRYHFLISIHHWYDIDKISWHRYLYLASK